MEDFEQSFSRLFPSRRLFITAPNEYGVQKLVTTTLRPTQLPYRELYDVQKCAEFVSGFLDYEPLEWPETVPTCLPSSTQVLKWSVGDSFDFSTLLCSFLLGAGYDAYVVYGYAPHYITTRDQTHTGCPYVSEEDGEDSGKKEGADKKEGRGKGRRKAEEKDEEKKGGDDEDEGEGEQDGQYKRKGE